MSFVPVAMATGQRSGQEDRRGGRRLRAEFTSEFLITAVVACCA